VGFLQPGDPAGRGIEQDPVAGFGGFDSDADGKVRFPSPGRPEKDNVFALGEEDAGAQMGDQVPVGGGLVVEVEVLQCLVSREPCGLDPQARPRCFPLGHFLREDRGEVFLMGPAGVSCLVAETAERVTDAGCAQGAGVVLDLRSCLAPSSASPGHDATAKTTGAAATLRSRAGSRAGSTPNSSS